MLKKVMGAPRRELEGEEYDHVWLMLQFLEPVDSSNNQHVITEVYHQGEKIFHVHYSTLNEPPIIEEFSNAK